MADRRAIGITGATGFVARALIKDLTSGEGPTLRLFGRRPDVLPDGRIIQPLEPTAGQLAGLDTLVHTAALTTSKPGEPLLTEINVQLAANLMSAAIDAGVRRFVFFSSMLVHGRTASAPVSPDSVFAPADAYGRSKAAAERALNHINRDGAIQLVVIRPPMIYGPGGKGSFNALYKLVGMGIPLPFGAAHAERSFCSVRNVVSATRRALELPAPPPVILPADPENFSTRSLIEAMAEAGGRSARLVPAPTAAMKLLLGAAGRGEMASSLFDPLVVDRSHWADWGWTPPVTGRQAVADTVAHLRAESRS